MATFGLNDKSLADLERMLRSMQGEVGKADREIARKAADDACEAARRACPVDTGELRDSIHVEESADGFSVVAEAPYAAFVEFGTGIVGKQAGVPTVGGYVQDGRGHGEDGWVYEKDGRFHHTRGQVGRSFMQRGAEEARRTVRDAHLKLTWKKGK